MLSPLIHQDDLRVYSSKDTTKIYHNRKMINLSEDGQNGETSSEAGDSEDGLLSDGEELLYSEGEGASFGQGRVLKCGQSELKKVKFADLLVTEVY